MPRPPTCSRAATQPGSREADLAHAEQHQHHARRVRLHVRRQRSGVDDEGAQEPAHVVDDRQRRQVVDGRSRRAGEAGDPVPERQRDRPHQCPGERRPQQAAPGRACERDGRRRRRRPPRRRAPAATTGDARVDVARERRGVHAHAEAARLQPPTPRVHERDRAEAEAERRGREPRRPPAGVCSRTVRAGDRSRSSVPVDPRARLTGHLRIGVAEAAWPRPRPRPPRARARGRRRSSEAGSWGCRAARPTRRASAR